MRAEPVGIAFWYICDSNPEFAEVFNSHAITVSKILFQCSSRSFFSLPIHHHRAGSTQTAPAMAGPLTDAERARVRAHMDHLDKDMAVITESEFDPDKVNVAHEAAARAYPVSKEVFQAYSAEVLTEMADP